MRSGMVVRPVSLISSRIPAFIEAETIAERNRFAPLFRAHTKPHIVSREACIAILRKVNHSALRGVTEPIEAVAGRQQVSNFTEREAEVLGMFDESDAVDGIRGEETESTVCAVGRRQESSPLVVPYRINAHAGA